MGAHLYRCSNWTVYKIAINRMEARKWPSDIIHVRCWYRLCVEIRSDINWIRIRNNWFSYRWERDFVLDDSWKTHQQICLGYTHTLQALSSFFLNRHSEVPQNSISVVSAVQSTTATIPLNFILLTMERQVDSHGRGRPEISLHCSLLTFVRDRHERVRTLSLEINLQVPLSSRK